LNFINWDHNYAFAAEEHEGELYPIGTYPSRDNLIEDPQLKSLYEQTICELLTYLVDPDYISELVNHNYSIISGNENGVIPADPSPLIEYISKRSQRLEKALSDMRVSCDNISYSLNVGDLVINEFVATSDSLDGIQEPDGGTPDWIELYNNTNADITLNKHYYLSDDKDFPKKWSFPEEVTIPGNSYLIIWADKDVHQQGIHAGFKIDKDGGDLLFTYEDMTEIQNVNYGPQVLNQGFARFPNGTGDFVIQPHTFNGSNSATVATDEVEEIRLILFPNPARDFIAIESDEPIRRISLFDISGREILKVESPVNSINVSNLLTGFYMMRLDFKDQTRLVKVMKK